MIRRFEAAGSKTIDASMLPNYDVVKDFYHLELQAPQLASSGDVVTYLPLLGLLGWASFLARPAIRPFLECCEQPRLIDHDKNGIMEHMDWDQWVMYSTAACIVAGTSGTLCTCHGRSFGPFELRQSQHSASVLGLGLSKQVHWPRCANRTFG